MNAAEDDVKNTEIGKRPIRLSIEYFYPTETSRNIRTINLNVFYPIKIRDPKFINLSFHAGLTATFATGDITQLEGDLNEGTFREVNYDNEAVGVGPGILADLRLWRNNKLSFHLNGIGSIIFYNKDFPAGGDQYNFMYNFMWRGGPVLRYVIGKDQDIGFGYYWMHVSNGQGLAPKNPSYDAQGPSLKFSIVY